MGIDIGQGQTQDPSTTIEGKSSPNPYSAQARAIIELALNEFQSAMDHSDPAGQMRAFYLLAGQYRQAVAGLRLALDKQNETIALTSLYSLLDLHHPLQQMHHAAPDNLPLPFILDRQNRNRLVSSLIVRALSESPNPIEITEVSEWLARLSILGAIGESVVRLHLNDLISSGHVIQKNNSFGRSERVYTEIDFDVGNLRTLVGDHLYDRLLKVGFRGMSSIQVREGEFRQHFHQLSGMSEETTSKFIEVAEMLLETNESLRALFPWHYTDLIGSAYPRPYQQEAYSVFRQSGYQGQLLEAPTGSGKTMIGMMCIQDWISTLSPGQSILVLVPTSNYQQQWISELCFNSMGLLLSPDVAFSGTPVQLEQHKRLTSTRPAVNILTYSALAQIGSGLGKGGFDIDSIEMFLQAANVQYVILDEVHKAVEKLTSVSADITRLLVTWLQDGSIRGLIGFSGTAGVYRARFASLGLELTHTVPVPELIANGFIAPFAEYGVPFSDSNRERQIRDLLDKYKKNLRKYLKSMGDQHVRRWFAQIPLKTRLAVGHELLGMYHYRSDAEEALTERFSEWEQGGSLKYSDRMLVSVLQVAYGWSDQEFARRAGITTSEYETINKEFVSIREDLTGLMFHPKLKTQLQVDGYGTTIDTSKIKSVYSGAHSKSFKLEQIRAILSTTYIGLLRELSGWYRRVGEGRVDTIKAIIDAERQVRSVTGVIVFDKAKSIPWRQGVANPGFEGVGGLFGHFLGDERFTVMAALSNEIYMTYSHDNPLTHQIASYIEEYLLREEISKAIFRLTTRDVNIDQRALDNLHQLYVKRIIGYLPRLIGCRRPRVSDFYRRVLGPVRRRALTKKYRSWGMGLAARLTRRNAHLTNLIVTFFDYAIMAEDFRQARIAQLDQAAGNRQSFFVVKMPQGRRKAMMYELVSRIVDAESLPVNMVIVSNWARTGWNVRMPNLLIDATATRDATAWTQLRGRAMRALPSWTNDCSRLIQLLLGNETEKQLDKSTVDEIQQAGDVPDENLRGLLLSVAPSKCHKQIRHRFLEDLTPEAKRMIAVRLMVKHNKVTHIYELVKAFGSTSQVVYNRRQDIWKRRKSIEAKHSRNLAVHPISGALVKGVEHAPFLYGQDPRRDLPGVIGQRVIEAIDNSNEIIVGGWLDSPVRKE